MQFGIPWEQIEAMLIQFSLHPNVEEVLIFGSRSKGTYHSGSDIDLALVGDHLKLDEIFQIKIELEALAFPLGYDLFLYNKISDREIVEQIKMEGKLFYKQMKIITPQIKKGKSLK